MFLVEIGKAVHRPRTYVLGAALAGVAVLPVILLATASDSSGGPAFFDLIRRNGLFAPLTALALIQPFFLPLGAGLLSGETIAAEASGGTLRYLLVRPVGRRRLIGAKYGSVMALLGASVLWVAGTALVAGALAFGLGELPTLSGVTIGAGQGSVRIVVAAAYVLAGVAGLAAIGVFISTLTDSAPGAAIATMGIAIVSQILDGLPSLNAVHPFLLSHGWFAWIDLFRDPIAWDSMRKGLTVDVVYTALFLGAALVVFGRKDVVS
jgi:ABC-2 type transport system permease protein